MEAGGARRTGGEGWELKTVGGGPGGGGGAILLSTCLRHCGRVFD